MLALAAMLASGLAVSPADAAEAPAPTAPDEAAPASPPPDGPTPDESPGETAAAVEQSPDVAQAQVAADDEAVPQAQAQVAAAPPPITPLGPVDPGPDESVPVPRIDSPANQVIPPLPALDPGPDQSVDIERAPVVVDPPVEPSPLTLPLSPAQEVIDGLATSALATLGSAGPGFVDGAGGPDLDPTKLQPQVASAQFLPTDPATLQETPGDPGPL